MRKVYLQSRANRLPPSSLPQVEGPEGSPGRLYDNLEGWDGEGDGRKVREGGDMGVPMADSC